MFGVPDEDAGSQISKYDYSSYGAPDSTATGPATAKLEPGDSNEKVQFEAGTPSATGDADSDLLKKIADNTNAHAANQKQSGDLFVGVGKQVETLIGKTPTAGDIANELAGRFPTKNDFDAATRSDLATADSLLSQARQDLDAGLANSGIGADIPAEMLPDIEAEQGIFGGILDSYGDFFSGYGDNISVGTSGSQCSFGFSVMGHSLAFNFCPYADTFSTVGSVLLACAYLAGFFIIFRRHG